MQCGFMQRVCRRRGPDVWQFRWSETRPDGKRAHHKKVVGTVEQHADEHSARRAVGGLITEINTHHLLPSSRVLTVAELCDHFEQRELSEQNAWRSYATKRIYKAYLNRWIRPHWQRYTLTEVRTMQVESWLRSLPLARSSCAKIRNLLSVLFNHACRYELFDRNPICLVRQSAKRRKVPVVLMPSEIKALVDKLSIRERTLVLLAVSTGLRQSELFGLKWGDIDVREGHMHVTRSIVYGVVGPCKTEASQKPVPIHSILAEALLQWKKGVRYASADDWVFASKLPRQKTVLGPSDPTQIHSSCGAECRNPEAIRMAHVPAHVLDSATKCRNRSQGDARTASTFNLALNVGRLHSGGNSGEACSASSGRVAGLFSRCASRTANCCHVATQKKGTKRARNAAFSRPLWFC
jgi:integrase